MEVEFFLRRPERCQISNTDLGIYVGGDFLKYFWIFLEDFGRLCNVNDTSMSCLQIGRKVTTRCQIQRELE